MPPLADTLAIWRGFYALLGEASATMVALLFVAVSVGAGIVQQRQEGANARVPVRQRRTFWRYTAVFLII